MLFRRTVFLRYFAVISNGKGEAILKSQEADQVR
jgi:hypothetical protein